MRVSLQEAEVTGIAEPNIRRDARKRRGAR